MRPFIGAPPRPQAHWGERVVRPCCRIRRINHTGLSRALADLDAPESMGSLGMGTSWPDLGQAYAALTEGPWA
jgi:hypothetical protein